MQNNDDTALLSECFLLASGLTAYPDANNVAALNQIAQKEGLRGHLSIVGDQWNLLADEITDKLQTESKVCDLCSDYVELFDWGNTKLSLYETEYGPRGKPQVLADIAGFYKAFGLDFGPESASIDSVDHISVQLEFYAVLLLKERALATAQDEAGLSITRDARMKFLTEHLGSFNQVLTEKLTNCPHEYYSNVFKWVCSLVRWECDRLGVTPLAVDSKQKPKEDDAISCGVGKCFSKGESNAKE